MNIINMAEHMKDDTDRLLEQSFRFDSIEDDGFSARVVSRIRRRVWIRRLALPAALVFGTLVGLKPLLDSVAVLFALVAPVAEGLASTTGDPLAFLPDMPAVLLVAMLAASALMIGRMLEE